jgi:Flp pilus assembly protein TadG
MIRRPLIRRRAEAGSVAVEFALILPALLFAILGAIQFGIVFWNWNSMLLAVEEAGRYAMLYNSTNLQNANLTIAQVCPSGVTTVSLANCAIAWANQNLGSPYSVTCSDGCDAGGNATGSTMTFKAAYTFNFITSFSLSRAIQVPLL